jgi:hypothetical protein
LISFVTSYRAFFPTVAPRASSFAAARVDRIIATPIGLLGDGAPRDPRSFDDGAFATTRCGSRRTTTRRSFRDARRDPALDRRVEE